MFNVLHLRNDLAPLLPAKRMSGLLGHVDRRRFTQEFTMDRRIESYEAKIFRRGREREILCRLTYEITPFRDGYFRWFLIGIEELE